MPLYDVDLAFVWVCFYGLRLFFNFPCFINRCSFNGVYQPRLMDSQYAANNINALGFRIQGLGFRVYNLRHGGLNGCRLHTAMSSALPPGLRLGV